MLFLISRERLTTQLMLCCYAFWGYCFHLRLTGIAIKEKRRFFNKNRGFLSSNRKLKEFNATQKKENISFNGNGTYISVLTATFNTETEETNPEADSNVCLLWKFSTT